MTHTQQPLPLRVGLIGAGGISVMHTDAWAALGAQVTVFSHEGAEEAAAAVGGTVADSLEALLASCDIVDIVTPTPSHRQYALAAIAAGKDVICEKPLARTAADAAEIAAAAESAGRRLFPAHVVRYFPEYRTLHRAVTQQRALGEVAVLRFSRAGAAPMPGSWFFDEQRSGGIIMDQMIHDLDQARWIAGPVVRVYAAHAAPLGAEAASEQASAHVTLTHASGAISVVQGSWGPPSLVFSTSVEVAGAAGVLRHDSQSNPAIAVNGIPADDSGYLPGTGGAESPYTAEIRDFVAAVAEGRDARVTPRDGVIAVALAEAALESVRTGQPVPFDESSW